MIDLLPCRLRAGLLLSVCSLPVACATPDDETAAPDEVRCPELSWPAFPSAADLARDTQGLLARAEHVRYEVRVFDERTGSKLFERRGVTTTTCRPELWIEPQRDLVWTVRPVFRLGGARRVGDWLDRQQPDSGPSRTARSTVEPVPLHLFPRLRIDAPGPADG